MNCHNDRAASIARKPAGFTVGPSPLNAVKLELGLLLVCVPVVWLVVDHLAPGAGRQMAWLGGYGLFALAWIILRVRQVVGRLSDGERHGAKQE